MANGAGSRSNGPLRRTAFIATGRSIKNQSPPLSILLFHRSNALQQSILTFYQFAFLTFSLFHVSFARTRARDSPLEPANTCGHLHGEKNLELNARELMSFTFGLFVVRMPPASFAMVTVTSCVQCTKSSLGLNSPTHLRKSLKSVGFIATLRCANSVKLTTRCFEEIPRTSSVLLLAIAFQAMSPLLRYRAAKLPGAWPKMKSQEISRKKSVGSLGNIPLPT